MRAYLKGMYALIMAGGVGSRFWPLSRPDRPKQFLKFFGERSLIQMTSDRLDGLVPPQRRFVVTNTRYVDETRSQLPEIPPENVLAESVGRNTAPCIAFGANTIARLDPSAVMIVLPADHLIQDVSAYHTVMQTAAEAASRRGVLVTMGIEPTYPATGFGYIEFGVVGPEDSVHPVTSFTEKPDEATARQFVDSGRYLWNSGMFCWRVDTILTELERSLPEVARLFDGSLEPDEAFERSPSISIDYGIMERAERVMVVPCSIGWNDVGDWRAAHKLSEKDERGNATRGRVDLVDASGCLAYSTGRRIVLVGTEDLVVVDAGDAILVCRREDAQRVKEAANLASDQRSA